MDKPRADYAFRVVLLPELPLPCILLIDRNLGRVSVTNDAEAVCAHLRATVPGDQQGRRIFYRDSEGAWDELIDTPDSVTFRPGPPGVDFEKAWRFASTAYQLQEERFT